MLSKTAKRRTGGTALRAGILLATVLGHAALVVVMTQRPAKTNRARPPATVAWLSLPALRPAAVPPPAGTASPKPDAAARPVAVPFTPLPIPPWSDKPIVARTAPRPVPNPCARPPNPGDTRPPDPACAAQIHVEPGAPLNLPGSLHRDEFGNIASSAGSIFARVPPDPPEQAQLDADKHYAALVEAFGPPYQPVKPPWADDPSGGRYGPTAKGPLIQFIEDRLADRPLTPQSTLSQ